MFKYHFFHNTLNVDNRKERTPRRNNRNKEKHASPEVVFKAITDPNELTNWFPDNAIFAGRVGGKVRFTFNKERSKQLRAIQQRRFTSKIV